MIAEFKKNKKQGRGKYSFYVYLGLGFALFAAVFLFATNLAIKKHRDQLNQQINSLQKQISDIEQKNQKLKEEISQAGTKEYLEKVAREQFNLKAPGEQVAIVVKDTTAPQSQNQSNNNNYSGFLGSWWSWLKSKF